jgi:hypothetical protein
MAALPRSEPTRTASARSAQSPDPPCARRKPSATFPLASTPAFYPEHAYDIAGLLKALRELPSGEEVRRTARSHQAPEQSA